MVVAAAAQVMAGRVLGATGFALGAAAVVFAVETDIDEPDSQPSHEAEVGTGRVAAGAGAWRDAEVARYLPRSGGSMT